MEPCNQEDMDARQLAGMNFRVGYNCAEAVLRAFCDKLQLDVPEEALRMASGFGGGPAMPAVCAER